MGSGGAWTIGKTGVPAGLPTLQLGIPERSIPGGSLPGHKHDFFPIARGRINGRQSRTERKKEGIRVKSVLIIGGGFSGCSAAHLLSLQGGWDITLVEAASYLGGGCKTKWYGGHPYTFGPRHFLTPKEKIFNYLNRYCPMRRCQEHLFLTYVEQDAQFYNYPIHVDDVVLMPDREQITAQLRQRKTVEGALASKNLEEYWLASVGQNLYDKFINGYSKKMWRVDDNRSIDDFSWSPKGVALKEGPREAWNNAISAYPIAANGYDDYFELSVQGTKVRLNTEIEHYDIANKTVVMDSQKQSYDIIINTISPDIVMNGVHGELPYIGRDFYKIVLPVAHAFPENVYFLYYAGDEPFTRLVEYKQFTRQNWDAPTTIIGMEIPSKNGRYYPVPFKSEMARAEKYFADMPDGVFSIGRAGSYQYRVDVDDCIDQAMGVVERLA
ncbi:MAG: FAD-dependent oxidoreductase [Magnetococcales bacterium]|nr:FAD-dependent oxidoreductase [Magnetococcales bacterium]